MIDLHSHLLPGVDDGSPSIDVSVRVLNRFRDEGVTVVACTPHLNASASASAPHEEYARILEDLRRRAPSQPSLIAGYEIMLDVPGADLTDPRLSLDGSGVVLVEFGRRSLPPNSAAELYRLRMSGIVPLVAHPERYVACTPELVDEWRSLGAVMQLDASTIFGRGARQKAARALLKAGLIDLVSSDSHGDGRSLAPARLWLARMAGQDAADVLTRRNPERLLRRQELERVPPIEVAASPFARLKALATAWRST